MKTAMEIVPGDIVYFPGDGDPDDAGPTHAKVARIEPVTYHKVLFEDGSWLIDMANDRKYEVAVREETHPCGCRWAVYGEDACVDPDAVNEDAERGAEGYVRLERCLDEEPWKVGDRAVIDNMSGTDPSFAEYVGRAGEITATPWPGAFRLTLDGNVGGTEANIQEWVDCTPENLRREA